MLSLKTLLNPAPSGREPVPFFASGSSSPSTPPFSSTSDIPPSPMDYPLMPPIRASKDPSSLAKSKLRGPIKYPPFENIDEASLFEIHRFRITSFGHIHQSCSHIPYNSGKKDFYEKTGRESFEVFRYEFTAPGHTTEYTIMWDYNVGLVRMTPFFKCCQYGKTVPAKMLNLNPGLKEITHSITGGSIAAQGYWMPYQCARAVCATFCYQIAGALIPLFGPTFPAECIRPDSAEFGRMVINPQLVVEATREAEIFRRLHLSAMPAHSGFPRSDPRVALGPYSPEERRHPFKPRLTCDPSWLTEDLDGQAYSVPNSASSTGSGLHGYTVTSRPSSSWAPSNHPSPQYDLCHEPNPCLTAVPNFAQTPSRAGVTVPYWSSKRRFDYEKSEHGYRRSASPMMSNTSAGSVIMIGTPEPSPARDIIRHEHPTGAAAAMALLEMRNPRRVHATAPHTLSIAAARTGHDTPLDDMHRHKRLRANSH